MTKTKIALFAIPALAAVLTGAMILPAHAGETLVVAVDIKPGSCPNSINTNQDGLVSVAIVGEEKLDVNDIDVLSITLAEVSPIRVGMEDVATPFRGELEDENSCTEARSDGWQDLTMKFKTQELVEAIDQQNKNGEVVILEINGNLLDGTPIWGEDVIIKRGPPTRR